ncbi:MAG: DUF5985 family protein [Pseudomonadota bacterium]
MATVIYALCAATSLLCAVLLLRSYARSRYRLLFWAGMCFVGTTLNNLLLVADKLMFPEIDLLTLRLVVALLALVFLLYGLIFDE